PLDTKTGKGPLYLGHEASGVVAEVGMIPDKMGLFKAGDRVAVNPVQQCNACPACMRGEFNSCTHSEVIGVYLRERLEAGVPLAEAMAESISDLDGAFNYLVLSPEGLGVVRDRFGFKPLVAAETDEFVAIATEEIALRKALPGNYRVTEPPPGRALFYPLAAQAWFEMV
ncbi:MAG: alcohol dehydrogenase catalytic domain-containing protein, partial [Isosphaeraceae bacterium]|nr:alcohol dehydrogenase catalytic domain-containing protein [Isosphaeraceae bacterium]